MKRKHCSHGPIATITNDSQVKTYMDNSNGVRSINSNAYNKVSSLQLVCCLKSTRSSFKMNMKEGSCLILFNLIKIRKI